METDMRTTFQRNVDRFYYLPAWRRLAHVTQVTNADGMRSQHNRLTHTLKVAQVARRLAEKLIQSDQNLVDLIDPDVVTAAAFAHDLGHPPFGHNGEVELDKIARENGLIGFEGNAQSFRILTRLTSHVPSRPNEGVSFRGLGLASRVLAASVKYPYPRDADQTSKKYLKFGYYEDDAPAFETHVLPLVHNSEPTLEGQIMDWADDITYALHDVEDFYTVGLVPLDALRCDIRIGPVQPERFAEFLDYATSHIEFSGQKAADQFADVAQYFPSLPYDGTERARAKLTRFTSDRISELIDSACVDSSGRLDRGRDGANDALLALMKQLTWFYVIDRPELSRSQIGARRMLKDLVNVHMDWVEAALTPSSEGGKLRTEEELAQSLRQLPPVLAEILRNDRLPLLYIRRDASIKAKTCRAVIDYISSLTEDEVVQASRLLSGIGGLDRL
ncbi:hypothetical protein CH252_06810 [Rhodococcus sp. 06-1477-1B]|nr:hypothetical protein CH252_06810 [Rhodococcus sp. 06-1477-1B]